jgi:hypothetical protein
MMNVLTGFRTLVVMVQRLSSAGRVLPSLSTSIPLSKYNCTQSFSTYQVTRSIIFLSSRPLSRHPPPESQFPFTPQPAQQIINHSPTKPQCNSPSQSSSPSPPSQPSQPPHHSHSPKPASLCRPTTSAATASAASRGARADRCRTVGRTERRLRKKGALTDEESRRVMGMTQIRQRHDAHSPALRW